MTNPDLLPMFANEKERLQLDSVTHASTTNTNPSVYYINANPSNFVTSQ
jgi:hypothetical protein